MKNKKLSVSTKKGSVMRYTKTMKNNHGNALNLFTKKYAGKWIALSADKKKILGSSESLSILEKRIKDSNAIYTRGLSPDITYAF